MMKLLSFFSLITATTFLLSGCVATTETQHGDALQTGPSNKLGLLRLPKFPIGKKGTYTFDVSGLDRPAYPSKIWIYGKTKQATSIPDYSDWVNAVFKVEVISGGKVIRSHQFRPNRFRQIDLGLFEHPFTPPTKASSGPTNYQVRVTVVVPSDRQWDEAKLILR